ncbi:hypothetical protein [Caballeronia sordidicola]|nr:hypothetical protein [Caballeronia sordidicola]
MSEILSAARSAGYAAFTQRETLDCFWREAGFEWQEKAMPASLGFVTEDEFNAISEQSLQAFEKGVDDYLFQLAATRRAKDDFRHIAQIFRVIADLASDNTSLRNLASMGKEFALRNSGNE